MDMYLKFQGGVFSLCRRFNNKERFYAKRERVSVFTDGSRRRMLKFLRSCVARYWVLGTLTYPREHDASDFRKDWRAFVERWRRVYGADPANSLFWFVEFQGNGQPHFHFYCNHYIERGWLATAWASVVGFADPKHARAGTRIETLRGKDSAARYAAKYASKQEQKELPDMFKDKAGRWWGIVGDRSVVSAAIQVDDYEYALFELSDVVKTVESSGSKLIYDDHGAKVWSIESKTVWGLVFKRIKRANKVLQQAEQKNSARIYRERRSPGDVLCFS